MIKIQGGTNNVKQFVKQVSKTLDGISKIYADNLDRSNSDKLRGITGRSIAMQATGRDLNNTNYNYCNQLEHSKNDYAEFKAVDQQNQ